MNNSLFDSFEFREVNPIYLKWEPIKESFKIDPEEVLYKEFLVTIEGKEQNSIRRLYTLTKNSLIESEKEISGNEFKYTSILKLRNPRVLKIQRIDVESFF